MIQNNIKQFLIWFLKTFATFIGLVGITGTSWQTFEESLVLIIIETFV